MTNFYIDLVARYVHILAVVTLIGGQVYSSMILPGALGRLSSQESGKLSFDLLRRQPAFVWGHLVAIVVSGSVMAAPRLPDILAFGTYGVVLAIKLLLVALLLAIAAVNSFSVVPRLLRLMATGLDNEDVRDQVRYLTGLSNTLVRLNIGLGLLIVLLAALLASL